MNRVYKTIRMHILQRCSKSGRYQKGRGPDWLKKADLIGYCMSAANTHFATVQVWPNSVSAR